MTWPRRLLAVAMTLLTPDLLSFLLGVAIIVALEVQQWSGSR